MSAPPGVLADVIRVMADVLMVDAAQLGPDSSPETLAAWDSVQHVTLIIALEQELGVRFAPADIEEALSVQAIAGLVARQRRP